MSRTLASRAESCAKTRRMSLAAGRFHMCSVLRDCRSTVRRTRPSSRVMAVTTSANSSVRTRALPRGVMTLSASSTTAFQSGLLFLLGLSLLIGWRAPS
jgi:hypothetical protein